MLCVYTEYFSVAGEGMGGALYWHDFISIMKELGFSTPRLVAASRIEVHNPELRTKAGRAPWLVRVVLVNYPETCIDVMTNQRQIKEVNISDISGYSELSYACILPKLVYYGAPKGTRKENLYFNTFVFAKRLHSREILRPLPMFFVLSQWCLS